MLVAALVSVGVFAPVIAQEPTRDPAPEHGYLWDEDAEDTAQEVEANKPRSGLSATLRAVDKITARVTDLTITLNEPVTFGTLEIVMRYCHKRPPEDTPEVFAFLEVDDNPPEAESYRAFTGWLFASTPALSALEHPVYDVWVIDCSAPAPETEDGKAQKSP